MGRYSVMPNVDNMIHSAAAGLGGWVGGHLPTSSSFPP